MDENNKQPKKAPLRYHETLDLFSDVVDKYYYENEVYVFRTVVNNPPTEFDITPTRRRHVETQGTELPFSYTPEEVNLMEDDEKKAEVGHDAVSVHKTEEKAIKEAKRVASNFSKCHTEEESRAYKYQQRGTYLVKFHVTPDKALISKKFHSSTGHGGILVREGVSIEDLMDPTYGVKKFNYDDNDDK